MPYTYDHGSGTSGDPYQVWTADDLNGVRDHLAAYFIQRANINLSGWGNWNPIGSWSPINTGGDWLSGRYDGNNCVISGLTVNTADWSVGLFGYIYGGTVPRVRINNATISGERFAGGISGYLLDGTIEDCSFNGSIYSNSINAGGIVSQNEGGTIERCFVRGSAEASSDWVGGITGYNTGTILDCYSRASVEGRFDVGGGIGQNASPGHVENVYATGLVTGSSGFTGGLMNRTWDTAHVVNCYYDEETSGQTDTGKGEPRTTAQMTYEPATNTYVDWDFDAIWTHDTAYTINAGYPYLFAVEPTFAVHSKIATAWKSGPAWIKKDGQWKAVTQGWIKEGGAWKPIIP